MIGTRDVIGGRSLDYRPKKNVWDGFVAEQTTVGLSIVQSHRPSFLGCRAIQGSEES